MKYRLDLKSLGIVLELDEESFKATQEKRVIDEKTNEFLYAARIIKCDDDTLLVVKESKFEKMEEQ